MIAKQDVLAHRGLTLPKRALRRLNEVGIFAQAQISLEHQHVARRYVVRGIEPGGAVKDIGRYITFCGPHGEPLEYLHLIDAVGVNGVHAAVVAPILVRIELFRVGRSYQLLITRHEQGKVENSGRPPLMSRVLFRGVDGFLESEEDGKGMTRFSLPRFWSRSGEQREIPSAFAPAVQASVAAASCVGCSHSHFLAVPGELGAARR
jgi:hypothetical protein